MLTINRKSSSNFRLMIQKSTLMFVVAVSLLLLGLSGCNNKDTAADSQIIDRQLPNSYPKEIPVYQPSDFERYLVLEGGRYIFKTTDDVSDVKAYYQQQFNNLGWTVEHVYDDGAGLEKLTVKQQGATTFVLALINPDQGSGGSFYIQTPN